MSGAVSYSERELGKIIAILKHGDILIVSEQSRLGRSMLEIMKLLYELMEKGIHVYAIKGAYKLDNSLQLKILSMVLCNVLWINDTLLEILSRLKSVRRTLSHMCFINQV